MCGIKIVHNVVPGVSGFAQHCDGYVVIKIVRNAVMENSKECPTATMTDVLWVNGFLRWLAKDEA